MKTSKTFLYLFLAQFFTVSASLITIPFYIKYLGPTSWGLISFILSIQLIFILFESGYSQGLIPYLVKSRINENFNRHLIDAAIRNYLLYSIFVLFGILVFSFYVVPIIQADSPMTTLSLIRILFLLALMIIFQYFGSLFRAILISEYQHIELSIITILTQTLRSLISILFVIVF